MEFLGAQPKQNVSRKPAIKVWAHIGESLITSAMVNVFVLAIWEGGAKRYFSTQSMSREISKP